MVLDITIDGPSGFDEAIATGGDDAITFDQLPAGERSQLQNSPSQDAIALLGGNDTVIDNDEGRLYFGNVGIDQLNGNGGSDTLVAGRDNDVVEGGSGDDFLFGNVGNDVVNGGLGNDLLRGGQNEDELNGGDGNDTLYGDIGLDTLTGGSGSDVFTLAAKPGTDTITDFQEGTDKLSLDGLSLEEIRIFSMGEGQTGISLASSGEQIAVLNDVFASGISPEDFVGVSSTPNITGDPGNSPNQAADLGYLTENGFTIEEFVGQAGDSNDYYRFSVPGTSNVNMSIENLTEDAGMTLFSDLNGDGRFVEDEVIEEGDSKFSGDDINETLSAGTYFLNVYPFSDDDNSEHELSLSATPVPSTLAVDPGNSANQAFPLGTLNNEITISSEFVGQTGDSNDYYRFSVPETSNVNISIENLTEDAGMTLFSDLNGDGRFVEDEVIEEGDSKFSGDDINETLGAGTYFLNVYPFSDDDNSEYDLSFSRS